jgi:uncharacterized protein
MNRKFLGTGLRFPLAVNDRGALATASGEERVEQSIAIILGTRLGERVMLSRFGCAVHDELFDPNDGTSIGILRSAVRDALSMLEARIDVLDIAVENPTNQPTLALVNISYRIRSNNAIGNVVYPFYIREGR